MFLVWIDRNAGKFRQFDTIEDAISLARQGGWLITECVPLGDPRLVMIEGLASGSTEYFGSVGANVIKTVIKKARDACKEAARFDFQRGRIVGAQYAHKADQAGPTEEGGSEQSGENVSAVSSG